MEFAARQFTKLSFRFGAILILGFVGVVALFSLTASVFDLKLLAALVGVLASVCSVFALRFHKRKLAELQARLAAEAKGNLDNKIRENSKMLTVLTEFLPHIVWRTNKQGEITYMNRRWSEFTGEEGNPPNWEKVIHPDDFGPATRSWADAIQNPTPFYSIEVRIRAKDGTYKWFLSSGSALLDNDGHFDGWVGAFTDIDEAKGAMAQSRQSALRFESMISESPSGMIIIRRDGTVKKVNEAWLKFWSFPAHAVEEYLYKGFNYFERTEPAIVDVANSLRKVFAGEKVAASEAYFDPNSVGERGRARYFESHFMPIYSENEISEVVIIFADITDRKLNEIAARESLAQLRTLTEMMPQMVWTANPHGTIDYINQRWIEYTGWKIDKMGQMAWRSLIHPEDVDGYVALRTMSIIVGNDFESHIRLRSGKTGEYRWHLVRAVCMRDEAGKRVKWLGTTTDVHADYEKKRSAS